MSSTRNSAPPTLFKSLASTTSPRCNVYRGRKSTSANRMDEVLQLRQALNEKNSNVNKNYLVHKQRTSKANDLDKFEDTEDEDKDELELQLSAKDSDIDENEEPNSIRRDRSVLISKLNLKSPREPQREKMVSLSSKAFRNQLSSRFKSTPLSMRVRKIQSSDDENCL